MSCIRKNCTQPVSVICTCTRPGSLLCDTHFIEHKDILNFGLLHNSINYPLTPSLQSKNILIGKIVFIQDHSTNIFNFKREELIQNVLETHKSPEQQEISSKNCDKKQEILNRFIQDMKTYVTLIENISEIEYKPFYSPLERALLFEDFAHELSSELTGLTCSANSETLSFTPSNIYDLFTSYNYTVSICQGYIISKLRDSK